MKVALTSGKALGDTSYNLESHAICPNVTFRLETKRIFTGMLEHNYSMTTCLLRISFSVCFSCPRGQWVGKNFGFLYHKAMARYYFKINWRRRRWKPTAQQFAAR